MSLKSIVKELKLMPSKLFNHVQIKVKDIHRSKLFYDSVMKILGYKQVLEIKDEVIGYGTSVHDMFEIRQADTNYPKSNAVHIAFNANSKKTIDSFYEVALNNNGKCNGKPGFRTEYEIGYYAAFVTDPDGNNIEAVFFKKS